MRHAFAAHDAATDRLTDIVTAVGDGHVAVSHRASQPTTRLIVDEYQRGSDGHYQLKAVGTDLCRYLQHHNCIPALMGTSVVLTAPCCVLAG